MSQLKKYTCLFCEDRYTDQDLSDLKEMGEKYHLEQQKFVCPDCYDDLRRLPLEEQFKALLQGFDYEWEEEEGGETDAKENARPCEEQATS